MRVCFTGRNRAGSWIVRGAQMSRQRANWYGAQDISDLDLDAYDIFCFVKRPLLEVQERLLQAGKILVLDVVDGWAQPDDTLRVHSRADAQAVFRERWQELLPFHAHILANRAMYTDLRPLTRNATYIYHHSNPILAPHPIRPEVSTVAYEGNESYLGAWREVIERLCAARGLRFLVNPTDYAEIDIGFAAREGESAGYLPNRYKSNVKLANFLALGTPCIVSSADVSYQETDPGGVRFFATEQQLERQLDRLLDYDLRQAIHECFCSAAPLFSIERITKVYEHFFLELLRRLRHP
ncbi:MAG: hypothetical protein WD100_03325 [Tistlia sp.]|uniref:hypothetical protein n=1 Tax=Tistlia sp. TaxID=3057121 RepID=UPI0034A1A7DF